MDDDFDNDMDLGEGNLDESLGDLGDLGDTGLEGGDAGAEFDDTSELGGTRSSGGARALTSTSEPQPVRVKKAVAAKPAARKAAPKKAAPKKAAKKAPKKAPKKAAPKKKAKAAKKKSTPARRKAGSKK